MVFRLRYLACLTLAVACALTVAACDGGVPAGAVAKIGDTVITKDQFDHWMEQAVTSRTKQRGSGSTVAPDPPTFARCVASQKMHQPKASRSKANDDYFRDRCEQDYEELRPQVMGFLIETQWVLQEAEKRGIEIQPARVRRLFEEQKRKTFPKERAFRRFLRNSGAAEADILFRVKAAALERRLVSKAQRERIAEITHDDVVQFYAASEKRFSDPEERDYQSLITRSRAEAKRIKRRFLSGMSFDELRKHHTAGVQDDVQRGNEESRLLDAIFEARKGEVLGPFKDRFGDWHVVKVTKITPPTSMSLEEAESGIRGSLELQRKTRALREFAEEFREEYRALTECREEFLVPECGNAPEEDETDTAAAPSPQGTAPLGP